MTNNTPTAPAGSRWLRAMDAVVEYAFHGLIFALPLAFYVEASFKIFEFAKLRVFYSAAAIIFGGWALGSVLRRRFVLYRTSLDIPLLIFALTLGVSTALSTDVMTSIWGRYATPAGAFVPTATAIGLYFAYVANLRARPQLMRSLWCLLAGGAVTAGFGVLQHYGLDWINPDQQVSFLGRSFGTLGSPVPQAWYVAMLLPAAAWMFLARRGRVRILAGALWSLLVLAILSTGTRSGFLGALCGVACLGAALAALRRRQPRLNLRPTLVLALLFALIVGLYVAERREAATLANRVSLLSLNSAATTVRYPLWGDALVMWTKYPVWGSGPETFGDQHNLIRTTNLDANALVVWSHAHNQYLHQLVTAGLIGLAAYLFVIGVFLARACGTLKRLLRETVWTDTPFDRIWPIALSGGIVSLLVSESFNPDYLATTVAFFILPAMVVRWNQLDGESRVLAIELGIPAAIRAAAAVGIGLLVALTLQQNMQMWTAHLSFRRAIGALERNNYVMAKFQIDSAVAARPSDADYLWVKAQTYAFLAVIRKREAQAPFLVETFEREAVQSSDRSVALAPSREDLWRQRAICLGDLSEVNPSHLAAAIDAINQAIARFPRSDVNYVFLARLESRIGRRDAAIQALVTATRLSPATVIAYAELGALHYRMGDREAAGRIVKRFLELKPTSLHWKLVARLRDEASAAGDEPSRAALEAYLRTLSPSQS